MQLRDELLEELSGRIAKRTELYRWYDGDHPGPDVSREQHATYRRLVESSKSNAARVTVDAVVERLNIDRFVTGNDELDAWLWRTWRASGMVAGSSIAHTDALVASVGYALAWPDRTLPTGVRLSVEDPRQCVHVEDPATGEVRGFLKMWSDRGNDFADVYTLEGVHRFTRTHDSGRAGLDDGWDRVPGDELVPLPPRLAAAGMLPAVPIPNAGARDSFGRSDLADVVPIQRRINTTTFALQVLIEAQSFRQRWATGIEIPVDPDTGEPVDSFRAAVSKLMMSENEGAKFGEFQAADTRPLLAVIEQDLEVMARVASLPPDALTPGAGTRVDDGRVIAEAPLVERCRERSVVFGDAWERLMRVAATIAGQQLDDVEAEWRSFETRTYGESADWAIKLASIPGFPTDLLWPSLGFTADEIRRARVGGTAARLIGRPVPEGATVTGRPDPDTGRIVTES